MYRRQVTKLVRRPVVPSSATGPNNRSVEGNAIVRRFLLRNTLLNAANR
jgi:hypothetical protein